MRHKNPTLFLFRSSKRSTQFRRHTRKSLYARLNKLQFTAFQQRYTVVMFIMMQNRLVRGNMVEQTIKGPVMAEHTQFEHTCYIKSVKVYHNLGL